MRQPVDADDDIKGVIFDVDGTLYWQTPIRIIMAIWLSFVYALRPFHLLKIINVIRSYRKAQEHLRFEQNPQPKNLKRQIELASRMSEETFDSVNEIVAEWFEKRPLMLLRFFIKKNTQSALEALKRDEYRLGVYSDYPADSKLKALGIRDFFSVAVSSQNDEVKGFKPNTNGFEITARKLGLQPHQTLYVGDRKDVDGIGAQKAGLKTLIVKNSWRFKPDDRWPDNYRGEPLLFGNGKNR